MRESKFRGKTKVEEGEKSEWKYGDLLTMLYEEPVIVCPQKECDSYENMRDGLDFFEVIPETVGVDTGLKDKNGKNIFEGDIIVGLDEGLTKGQIKWADGGFIETIKDEQIMESTIQQVEVIGNIHDNPELLEFWEQKEEKKDKQQKEYKIKDIVTINGLQYIISTSLFLMPIGADCKKINCQECKFNFNGKGNCPICLRNFDTIGELNNWIKKIKEDYNETN